MKDSFSKAIAFSLLWEQWKSDDSADPGKLTIWGIASAYWPKDVERMKDMTSDQAKLYAMTFYKEKFWDALKCDDLSFPLDIVAFDSAVNLGIPRVKAYLELTMDWRDIIMYRIQHYTTRKGSPFLAGWVNRCVALWNMVKKGGD